MRTQNKVIILGHATRDPENLANNNEWCKLGVTTNTGWGEKSKPHHHSITIFDPKKTEFVMQYIKKGMIVYVEGEIQYTKKEDKWYTSIVVGQYGGAVELCEKKGSSNIEETTTKEVDDDIPF